MKRDSLPGVGHTRVKKLVLVNFERRRGSGSMLSCHPFGNKVSSEPYRRKADPAELSVLKQGEDVKRGGAQCEADCGANDYVAEEVHAENDSGAGDQERYRQQISHQVRIEKSYRKRD